MGYTSIKCHQGKCLQWRRVILIAVLFMFGLLPVFFGPGNVASAAPAAKQTQAKQSKATTLDLRGRGGGGMTGGGRVSSRGGGGGQGVSSRGGGGQGVSSRGGGGQGVSSRGGQGVSSRDGGGGGGFQV